MSMKLYVLNLHIHVATQVRISALDERHPKKNQSFQRQVNTMVTLAHLSKTQSIFLNDE